MKSVEEVTAVVCDYGTFASLAEKLAETMAKVYYYCPFEAEYLHCEPCMQGTGLVNVERVEELVATGATTIGVACPFCQSMFRDALAAVSQNPPKLLDVAQIMAASLQD